jgi:Arc/MetJ-type ribon-helix-helix transcriptional regulator
MRSFTIRLPEPLIAEIESESHERKLSKSDVIRERLELAIRHGGGSARTLDSIRDLIGSVSELPADLSSHKKAYLRSGDYGQKRPR